MPKLIRVPKSKPEQRVILTFASVLEVTEDINGDPRIFLGTDVYGNNHYATLTPENLAQLREEVKHMK